jgi:4-hydroxy-tetrahydrodipicolinate reductase
LPNIDGIIEVRIIVTRNTGMSNALKLGVNGAAGRMGQRVVALATQDKALRVTAAYESAASSRLGQDVGELAGIGKLNIPIQSSIEHPVDVIIDFSTPEGCSHILALCESRRIPLVIATTGLTEQQKAEVA